MLKSFRELEVWQKAHALVLEIYRVSDDFPDKERYGITAQLRRAAVSVPANIAEGFARRSTPEFMQSLTISNGSLEEARYLLILARDLSYLRQTEYDKLDNNLDSIAQMLAALSRSLKNRMRNGQPSRVAGRGSRAALSVPRGTQ
ncbi:MAG TPA: four helix bundle protein [Candidatus Acidoferrales bacterium]|nr:four helix bundle protein [Candidatus Acidoferrales bacterium]